MIRENKRPPGGVLGGHEQGMRMTTLKPNYTHSTYFYNRCDAISQFRDAMRAAGLEPPDVIEPGRMHRFPGVGKRNGNRAGWCKLFDDGMGGCFGDWSSGFSENWQAKREKPFSTAEGEAFKRHVAEAQAQAEAQRKARQAETSTKAVAICHAGATPRGDNPYLMRKRVNPVDTLREIDARVASKILGYPPRSNGDELTGRLLVVPVTLGDGISTVELIDGEGRKTALAGGAKAGGYWATEPLPDGDGDGLVVAIGEGVATVLTVRAALMIKRWPADRCIGIAALSACNLLAVAKAMRGRYPAAKIIILADLVDKTGEPEPRAIEAARSVRGFVAAPNFGPDRPPGMTDFNDVVAMRARRPMKINDAIAAEVGV